MSATQGLALSEKFQIYFSQNVAMEASAPLKSGAQICFEIDSTLLLLTKEKKKLNVTALSSQEEKKSAQILFTFSQTVSDEILNYKSDSIGDIGIHLIKMIVEKKINFKLQSGFLTLFRYGYFGILTLGGKPLTQFLARYGFSGIQSLKMLFKKES